MPVLSYQAIASLLPESAGKIYVAYSGGIDSHVMLHLCATQSTLKSKIVAVYVNHGLQTVAAAWGEHCRRQAERLGVDFQLLIVDARAENGQSPEAAAREARYQALRNLLTVGDVLLLAQHREDQMETLLLQLFRGAGVAGLAGMPVAAEFGLGRMLRPLLNVAKQDIEQYAQTHRLQWVEDPTNQSSDFDRNYLRNQILPLLKQRWPSLDKTVARSAAHCGDATRMIDDWTEQTLQTIFDPADGSLSISDLPIMSAAQRNGLLRRWLSRMGLKPPSQAVLQTLVDQLIDGRDDAQPQLYIQGCYIKKYRQKLFCIAAEHLRKQAQPIVWPRQDKSVALSNGYVLSKVVSSSGIAKSLWDISEVVVAARQGGEKLKLPGRIGHHCLKKLYQEAAVPPWERDARPLIYLGERLAAVAGLWVAEWAWCDKVDDCYRVDWRAPESV